MILVKLAIILACSLANNIDSPFFTHKNNTTQTCPIASPCDDLNSSINALNLILIPSLIGTACCTLTSSSFFIFKSRQRLQGIRASLWCIFVFWVHILLACSLYMNSHKAHAYVWILHSTCLTLYDFASLLPTQGLLPHLGIISTIIFAYLFGPPAGLVPFHSTSHAQCGWSLHLLALLGIESIHASLSSLSNLVQFAVLRMSFLE